MYLGMSCLTKMSPESNTENIKLPRKDRMLLMLNLDDYIDYDLSTQLLQTRENICKIWTSASIVLCKHVKNHNCLPFHKIFLAKNSYGTLTLS
jgi:hypothetical protein